MIERELAKGVLSVGVIDWDRRLFDELIPLPDGTSYNAYLVTGKDKVALIDTVDPTKQEELISNLRSLGVSRIDYIIPNHAEQDHSGAIPRVLEEYPMAKVATNHKCKDYLKDMLHVPEEKFVVVGDGETLFLGGKTLEFILAPWVHWPETMFTYLIEDKIMFTCDFLGSHFASSDLYAVDEAKVYESAKRYYAEIMMPFRTFARANLEKVKAKNVKIIATSHGPIYNKPEFIIKAYEDWTSDKVKNEVIIAYVSMHGSTEKMAKHLTDALISRGITVKPFNLTRTDIGELAIALVDAATIVVASPTVLGGPHPAAVYATYLANALRPKTRFVSIIGSFEWGGKTVEQLAGMIPNLKVEVIPPVMIKGLPKEIDYKALDELADAIVSKHKEMKE